MQIQADDIGHLGGEGRIPTDLVGPREMRLQAMRAQEVGDAATGAADDLAQQPRRPSAPSRRRGGQRQLEDLLDGLGRHGVIAAPRLRLIAEPVDTGLHKPPSNPRDRLRRQIELNRNVDPAGSRSTQQNDARPTDEARGGGRAGDHRLQLHLLFAGDSHAEGSMCHPQNRSHA
jgi:hypothetical protein